MEWLSDGNVYFSDRPFELAVVATLVPLVIIYIVFEAIIDWRWRKVRRQIVLKMPFSLYSILIEYFRIFQFIESLLRLELKTKLKLQQIQQKINKIKSGEILCVDNNGKQITDEKVMKTQIIRNNQKLINDRRIFIFEEISNSIDQTICKIKKCANEVDKMSQAVGTTTSAMSPKMKLSQINFEQVLDEFDMQIRCLRHKVFIEKTESGEIFARDFSGVDMGEIASIYILLIRSYGGADKYLEKQINSQKSGFLRFGKDEQADLAKKLIREKNSQHMRNYRITKNSS